LRRCRNGERESGACVNGWGIRDLLEEEEACLARLAKARAMMANLCVSGSRFVDSARLV
jgi:hypothetical protein